MNIWIYIKLNLFSFVTIIVCESVPCNLLSVAPNGLRCYPCGIGYSKVAECVADRLQSQCKPCDIGKYQPECTTALECARCRICQPNQRIIQECNVSHDRVCECKAGTFWEADAYKTDEGYCKQHTQCGPGQALVRQGTAYRDTACEQCIEGKTFSNSTSLGACRSCTFCTTSYERECTTTMDAICGQYHYSTTEARSDLFVVYILVPVAVAGAVVAVIIVLCKRYRCFCFNTGISDEQKQDLSQLEQSDTTNTKNFSGQYVDILLEDKTAMSTTETSTPYSRNEDHRMTAKLNTFAVSRKETDERSREFQNHTRTTEYLADEQVGKFNSLSEDAGRVSPRGTISDGPSAVGFYQCVRAVDPQSTCQPQESVETRESTPDEIWDQVMTYLEQNVKRSEFKIFFRKLARHTNLDYFRKIEAELSNKEEENGNKFSEEVVHQLMLRYRQTTPKVKPHVVIGALRQCNFNQHADTLSRIIDEQRSGNTSTLVRAELES